ncbi:MAG TPA: aminotransferase class V-fold PLP-dependent enzyme [Thermoanaerobaculia bacterium]|nr:aminotransferase class V-fold PLP-dependent enzyme [Thermoanaerobaculia bacterium]
MLTFDALRRREFSRLDEQRHTYADYTGSALYGASQIRAHYALVAEGIFGNPHAESPASRASTEAIDRVRDIVLRFFDADASTHEVIFTANASAAIKLVAESYPFDSARGCVLSIDNHNSVNGIREYARRAGAETRYVNLDRDPLPHASGLFAFPAQSNFSGALYPLSLVDAAHGCGLDVLLDAAAYASSHPLSLRECRADFVAMSFYKLFGYPTGVGALIARRDALTKLRRPWFAGGTVMFASIDADRHRLRSGHDAFEDGTPNFLSIAALPAGFALLDEIGMDRVHAHVGHLTQMFHDEIAPVATMYGRGTFNLEGRPYWEIEEDARRENISLRGGCFCNPGASELAFGLQRVEKCLDEIADDFTAGRFAACTGRQVGAIRASFGIANNERDVRRVVSLVLRCAQRSVAGTESAAGVRAFQSRGSH